MTEADNSIWCAISGVWPTVVCVMSGTACRGCNFYVGNQWDAADLEKLAAEKRPALTINLILPIINLLAGIQQQRRPGRAE